MWEQRGLGQCVVGREWGGMFSDSDEDAVAGIALAVLLRRQRSSKPWMRDYLRHRDLREGHGDVFNELKKYPEQFKKYIRFDRV